MVYEDVGGEWVFIFEVCERDGEGFAACVGVLNRQIILQKSGLIL